MRVRRPSAGSDTGQLLAMATLGALNGTAQEFLRLQILRAADRYGMGRVTVDFFPPERGRPPRRPTVLGRRKGKGASRKKAG